MGDILNIITEDYELLDINHYYQRIYEPSDKSNLIKSKLRLLGVSNINYVTLEWALKNKNHTCVYFIFKLAKYNFSREKRFLDKKFINAMKTNQNIKIIYFIEDESLSENDFKLICEYLKFEEINEQRVYLYNNNSSLKEYCEIYKSKINTFKSSFLAVDYSRRFKFLQSEFKFDKKFLFLSQNKRLKSHRFALLCFLKNKSILESTDWSFILNDGHENIDFFLSGFLDRIIDTKEYHNEINYFCNKINFKNYHERDITDSEYGKDFMIKETFEESYVNLVTESHFFENDIHITEKSFKPFYFYQIPIFISTYKHVSEMKKLYNFDLFDDLINHDYDNEIDNKKRMNRIFDEILRVYKNKDKIKKFYIENKHRFEKNKKMASELININESTFFYNL